MSIPTGITIKQAHVPLSPLAARALPRIDYLDTYSMPLPQESTAPIDALTRALFRDAPYWVQALLALRDGLVAAFGLKTTRVLRRDLNDGGDGAVNGALDALLRPGDLVGIFRVFQRTGQEVLLGQNDRHLDFRVSIVRQPPTHDSEAATLLVSTLVCYHNLLGRLYFLPVRPFHQWIVPAMMASAAPRLANVSAS